MTENNVKNRNLLKKQVKKADGVAHAYRAQSFITFVFSFSLQLYLNCGT